MNKLLQALSQENKKKIKKRAMPRFEEPMLATLIKDYFSDPDWIYERKFDGVRCLVFKKGAKVTLKSRNDKSLQASYPEIAEHMAKRKVDQVILDGEIVAFEGKVTSFQKLQPRFGLKSADKARSTKIKVYMYIFDILYLDGYDVTKLPLIKRKSLLKKCMKFSNPLFLEILSSMQCVQWDEGECD